MAVRIIKNWWWVDFTFDRRRYRKRSPANSRAAAHAYEVVLRNKLAKGGSVCEVGQEASKQQTFAQFAQKWFAEYVVANNKPSEQHTKKYILSASLVPFFGKMPIGKIAANDIEKYKAWKLREGAARKTVNNQLTVLRTCLSTAYEWLELEGTTPKSAPLKCPPPKTDYLSPAECGLLLSHAEGVIHEMILMALRTGMRQGELKGLQWSSIDWQDGSITVRHSLCDYSKELGSPKGNHERHIPLDVEVYALLLKRKKDEGYVFLGYDGSAFNSKRLNGRLANVCRKAGLRIIGWHALRHTFASHLAAKGVPLNAVQALLGHSTIVTTMRYAHLAPSTLRSAIDLLNPERALGVRPGQPVGNPWQNARAIEIGPKTLVSEMPLIL